jgi:hypothetical protein
VGEERREGVDVIAEYAAHYYFGGNLSHRIVGNDDVGNRTRDTLM